MLVFIRNSWVVLQCGCIILYFCQQCIKVPFAPYSCQHLVLPIFVILRVSGGWVVISYLVLFSIFLTINEFFFPRSYGPLKSFAVFLHIGLFFLLKCNSSLYILSIRVCHLSDMCIIKQCLSILWLIFSFC